MREIKPGTSQLLHAGPHRGAETIHCQDQIKVALHNKYCRAQSCAGNAVREGVPPSGKPPENNGEDIDTKQSGNHAVREGGESVRKIVCTHKGVSPERDGDTVCRVCAGKTVF